MAVPKETVMSEELFIKRMAERLMQLTEEMIAEAEKNGIKSARARKMVKKMYKMLA